MSGRATVGLLVLAYGCAIVAPAAPPGSASARVLATTPFEVGTYDAVFVDASRPNDPRATAGCDTPRTLATTVWFPRASPGPHPLVVYSHGLLSNRQGGAYLAAYLARRGYVVAAPDHPLTRRWAPDGVSVDDVVNQPADLRVVIDRILAWNETERPFEGTVDPGRIGVMGLSLGGMTATLTAFHPRLRDARIAAAVSIAGPMTLFAPALFATSPVPFLMVAGDADVVVDYAEHTPLALERVPGGELVTVAGGSHAGFDDAATGILRAAPNADAIACWWLELAIDLDESRETLATQAAAGEGVVVPAPPLTVCRRPPPSTALDSARQQLVTKLAVGAFFDSHLASDPVVRRAAAWYLRAGLAADFPEVRFSAVP